MATVKLIEYEAASPEVRAVYDDIMATRQIDWINNFWKALALQPELLRRTWQGVKEVTAPGALDPLVKEMLYVAISVTNGCKYCINSHTAAARKKEIRLPRGDLNPLNIVTPSQTCSRRLQPNADILLLGMYRERDQSSVTALT